MPTKFTGKDFPFDITDKDLSDPQLSKLNRMFRYLWQFLRSESGFPNVAVDGSPIGTQPTVNFAHGTNVTISGADDTANKKIDISISASGGGGGGTVTSVTASSPLSSSGGATPNITIAVPLPVIDGGTGTATPGLVAGTNVSITGTWPDQTINATAGGTVTTVTASAPITSSGGATPNIAVNLATSSTVGVVKPDNVTVTVDGTGKLVAVGSGGTVTSVGATAPITSTGGATPTIAINDATSGTKGAVEPDNTTITVASGVISVGAITESQVTGLATDLAGKVTNVTASAPISSSGGTTPNITVALATSSTVGVVKPDNTTVTIASGILTATGSGGTVTAVTGSAPITSSGGTTPDIAINDATSSTKGAVKPDNTTITVATGVISVGAVTESQVTGLATDLAAKVPTLRTISTTAPLTGGGDLSADRTFAVSDATSSTKGIVQPDNTTVTITGGVLSATGSGGTVTSVTATAPITSTAGTTPVIAINDATSSTVGAVKPDNTTVTISSGILSVGAIAESQVTSLVTDLTGKATAARLINTTAPLTGGGDLSADRTLAVSNATSSTVGVVKPDNTTVTISGGVLSVSSSGGGALFAVDPAIVGGLYALYYADQGAYKDAGVTLCSDGDTIQQWNDQSGNGRNLSQATSGKRPTYHTAGGPSSITKRTTWAGGQCLQLASAAISTFSIFMMFRGQPNNAVLYEQSASATANDGLYLYTDTGNSCNVRKGGVVSGRNITTTWGNQAQWTLSSHRYCGDHASHHVWFGSAVGIGWGSSAAADPGSSTITDTLNVGSRNNAASLGLTGDIICLAIFTPHISISNSIGIATFLATKYNY